MIVSVAEMLVDKVAGCGWCGFNSWLWLICGWLWLVVAGCGWLWLVSSWLWLVVAGY
jgi:hypothetical protein